MTNELHQPKSMTKYELFQLYYPGRDKKQVFRFFKTQIHSSKKLMKELHENGYRKTLKFLTTNQVALIFEHLTPPVKQEKEA